VATLTETSLSAHLYFRRHAGPPDSVTTVRSDVQSLYALALLMQLVGAFFVITDVRRSAAAMRQFVAANQFIDSTPGMDWPEQRQKALADLAEAQKVSAWRRWVPVGVLILGVVLGFVGNWLASMSLPT
jgi:hypothetical protein